MENHEFSIIGLIIKSIPEETIKKETYNTLTKGSSQVYFDYAKNLKNDVYLFDNTFSVEYDTSVVTIKKTSPIPNIYSQESPYITVNAIVGKNGSGKSSIADILYLMLYNLAHCKGIVTDEYETLIEDYKGFLNASLIYQDGDKIHLLDFEILNYKYFNESKKDSKNISYESKAFNNNLKFKYDNLAKLGSDKEVFALKKLFYVISLNYSLYGLNELNMGDWIKHIFHKNDVYQTPIVINPYRVEGNIDVNKEYYLNIDRTISNLITRYKHSDKIKVSSDYDFSQINAFYSPESKRVPIHPIKQFVTDNSKEKATLFNPLKYIKPSKSYDFSFEVKERMINASFDAKISSREFVTLLETTSRENFELIIEIISRKHSQINSILQQSKLHYNNTKYKYIDQNEVNEKVYEKDILLTDLYSYFIYKLYIIGYRYGNIFDKLLNKNKDGFNEDLNDFKGDLLKVLTSESHISFKIRRAFNFINNFSNYFKEMSGIVTDYGHLVFVLDFEKIKNINSNIEFKISDLKIKNEILSKINKGKYDNIFNFYSANSNPIINVPPPIFSFDIILEKKFVNKDENLQKVAISKLSSGETQLIYTIQTILYHLMNIASNHDIESDNDFIKYENAVILLDEIELYFHPEYQRLFIKNLLEVLKDVYPSIRAIKNIQIILITHSPFILSDIPSENTLRLKDGKAISDGLKTFGANIYNLLKNQFFLEDGFQGEFAKDEIRKVYLELYFMKIEKEIDDNKQSPSVNLESIKNSIKEEYLTSFKIEGSELSKPRCTDIEYWDFIQLIGEPLIRNELQNLHIRVFNNSEANIKMIKNLMKEFNVTSSQIGQ